MKNSDRLRYYWLDRDGHHPMLTTMYGPFRCYDKWKVRAYTVASVVLAAAMIWGMR